MLKAKTRKNIFSILSVCLGVVFALITGVTYCVSSLNLSYGTNPNSASAYLGNQQYHIVNDTINNPITFGDGSHNFEVALQYSFDYDFDARFQYEVKWYNQNNTVYKTANNVILNFANRDKIIYDENYIYLVDSITAGSGKLTFITGVEFVDTNQTEYFGKLLKINITNVKIHKAQNSYSSTLANNYLTKDETSSLAAQTWVYSKNRTSSGSAYTMMYNYRRSFEYGVPYPGYDTAYKKPVATETYDVKNNDEIVASYVEDYVYAPAWGGGNRAYAGIGMYVVTGTSAVKLSVEVSGIWRVTGDNLADKNLISENSIRYNYTSDWVHKSWDASNLWETRSLTYSIPASTVCYINILDNVEITSADRITTNAYDSYRAVTNKITVNPDVSGKKVEFTYSGNSASYIQLSEIQSDTDLQTSGTYASSEVDVVNTSLYSNNLYSAQINETATEQTFNTNVSLINNTNETKTVTMSYQLMYHTNNVATNLVGAITEGGTKYRADYFVENNQITKLQAFKSTMNYTYEEVAIKPATQTTAAVNYLTSTMQTSVTVAPYSSVNVVENYTVGSGLQGYIADLFDPDGDGGSQADKRKDYYDAWTYLIVTPTVQNSTNSNYNLAVETIQNGTTANLSVKNNTNETVKGVQINNVSVSQMTTTPTDSDYDEITAPPKDLTATYWNHYSRSAQTPYTYTQLTTVPETEKVVVNNNNSLVFADEDAVYYELNHGYNTIQTISPVTANGFSASGNVFTNADLTLQPGESIVFATLTISSDVKLFTSATAVTTSTADADGLMLVDSGSENAYLINYASDKSYYVRFTGVIDSENYPDDFQTVSNYNYYLGIVRPGQVVSVPMTTKGVVYAIEAGENYSADALKDAQGTWDSTIIKKFTNLFALVKTNV